jgi:farnesyl-diphosphate farnesyltransferase
MTISHPVDIELSDWDFCRKSLSQVSRTFAKPIQILPEIQKRALTVGYLLCRVVDTIEDCVGFTIAERDGLFSDFQAVLRGEIVATHLSQRFEKVLISEEEGTLISNLHRVLSVFHAQSESTRTTTSRWVSEMADGMRLYCRRSEGKGLTAMINMMDLERYCYFVAGTVGHMITEFFDEATGHQGLEIRLRENAESFGLGLQLVNIVKDVTDDAERGICYIPRQVCRSAGLEPEQLLDPKYRAAAKEAVEQVIQHAIRHLEAALEYSLTIPPEFGQLRLFCLLPLWMAMETLQLARNNDAVFERGQKVKITRQAVERILAECARDCHDDIALRESYERLKQIGPRIALSAVN